MDATYILPIKSASPVCTDGFTRYLRRVASVTELIIVDGSPPDVRGVHTEAWSPFARVVAPRYDTPMGKVGGVMTGVELARHDHLIIADDDIRYDLESLHRLVRRLEAFDVVRPQNYFEPLPWHARWDTGRMLLGRATGGDWPGTLGVRRRALLLAGGYRGDVMFENLELVRTIVARGGREHVAYDLFVRRVPPPTRHFLSQRVRQAYDELARPVRMTAQLTVLPLLFMMARQRRYRATSAGALSIVALAEAGRRRSGGRRVFERTAALWAPLWLAERAVCSWIALGARVFLGGIPYRGRIVPHAASSMLTLRRAQTHEADTGYSRLPSEAAR